MNRSQIIEKNGHQVILDAYNANPTSMLAAINNFINSEGKNKLLILGDMFELGSEAPKEHQYIVTYLEKNTIGKVFLVGKNFYKTKVTSNQIQQFESFEDFKKHLSHFPLKNCFILIKGSRGMALERVVDVL